MRSTWEDFTVPGQEKYEKTQIISYGTDGQQTMNLTLPKNKNKTPLVIFFHGGGMTVDSRRPGKMRRNSGKIIKGADFKTRLQDF